MTSARSRAAGIIDALLGKPRALLGKPHRGRLVTAALAILGALVCANATLIEPYRIEVSRHTVSAGVQTPLVIAHLSDLHTHGLGRRETTVIEILDRERPDVIVVTGDLVDEGDLEPARPLFAKLRAPLGVWVVRGNWENWEPPSNERSTLASFGATLLVNEGTLLRHDIWLAGLDDPMSGNADVDEALRGAPPDATKLGLFHSPEVFDRIAPRIDLAFAGHTHGGQVQLPILGAVWTPPGSGRFLAGWYSASSDRSALDDRSNLDDRSSHADPAGHDERSGHADRLGHHDRSDHADRAGHADRLGHDDHLGDSDDGDKPNNSAASARLFVSRGVGMSVLPIRFLCRPEVAIITIRPSP